MRDCTEVWKQDREASEMAKLEAVKREIQRTQIKQELKNPYDALLLCLIRRGVI